MSYTTKARRYLMALLVLIIFVVEVPIIATGQLTTPEPGDVIIVLGAKLIGTEPSTMLRLRLDEALRLYNNGYGGVIIVSGAQGSDEAVSEASAMREYLVSKGVSGDKIILEDKSYNTQQNLSNSLKLMKEAGLSKAVIVSNASHIRRSLVIAQQLGLNATGAPAPMANNVYLTTKQYAREGAAMLSLLVLGP